MATPKVYVLCDQNCKYEGMTREQILAAITQAVNDGNISNIDTGFVQTIKTINGHGLKFFVGEQSEYDTLTEADKENLFAIITNDTTKDGLLNAIKTLQTDFNEYKQGVEKGTIFATNATNATNATKATNDKNGNTLFGRKTLWSGNYPGQASAQFITPTLKAAELLNKFIVFEFEVVTEAATYLYRTQPFKVTTITNYNSTEYFDIHFTFYASTKKEDKTQALSCNASPRVLIPRTQSYSVLLANSDGAYLKAIYEVF